MSMISRRHLLAAGAVSALPVFSAMAASGLTLAQIKAAGELRIGCEASYVPFTFRKGGAIVGYDVELAELLCKPLGVKPVFVDTAWAGVIPSLYTKKFDMVMSSMSYTKERVERVGFTVPYAEASQALLIRAGDVDKIKTVADLNGRTLAVKLGSPGQILQEKINASLKNGGGKGFKELRTFDDHPAAYVGLAQGRVDGVLNTLATLAMVLKDAPGKYALVKGMGGDNWAGIAARKEDSELIAYLDEQLKALKASGAIYALQEKWFGVRMHLADSIPSFS
jgi:polar amino acid transport system substrate-binding protein